MVKFKRALRHIFMPPVAVKRYFTAADFQAIEELVTASETAHSGELKVIIESSLDWREIYAGKTARERALELFSQYRLWDTAENSGILIYVLLADHEFEIVADRGIIAKIPPGHWEKLAMEIELEFKNRHYREGIRKAVKDISAELAKHFPPNAVNKNEISDAPVIL